MSTESLNLWLGGIVCVAFICVLCAISVIDWRMRRIPNVLVVSLVGLRLLVLVVDAVFGQGLFAFAILAQSLLNALCFTTFLIVAKFVADKVSGTESLGWGDVKLVAVGALFLTVSQTFASLIIACVAALVLAAYFKHFRNDATFPFGPALALGLVIGMFLV